MHGRPRLNMCVKESKKMNDNYTETQKKIIIEIRQLTRSPLIKIVDCLKASKWNKEKAILMLREYARLRA